MRLRVEERVEVGGTGLGLRRKFRLAFKGEGLGLGLRVGLR